MKAILTAITLAALWAAPARAVVQGLERVSVAGADYVRVGEWAEESGLTMNLRKNEDAVELTNQTASVRLETDSHSARKLEINGVTIWLSLPVILRGGVPWISLADVQTTLEPVLFPRKSRARVETICLDPGHGGRDPGNNGGGGGEYVEKKYTLLLAQAVEKLLEAEGFKVVLTRTKDVYVDLQERPALAARAGADLFVSLHYNSDKHPVGGVEVHCLAPAGMESSNAGGGLGSEPAYPGNAENGRNILLAYQVLKSITTTLPLEDIGVKRGHLKVLTEARMPAILIEGGFMTDPEDAKKIYDTAFRQRMARAIVDGILAYKKSVEEAGPATVQGNMQVKVPDHGSRAPDHD